MALTVTINGTTRTTAVKTAEQRRTLRIRMGLGSTWECDVPLQDTSSLSTAYRPSLFETLVVAQDGTTIFSGRIVSVRDTPIGGDAAGTLTHVTARAALPITDQVQFDVTYAAGQTLKQIVTDLVTDYLAAYGISLDAGMATGPTLDQVTFDKVSAADGFNYLTQITGYVWRLRPDSVLEFFTIGSKSAAFSLTASNGNQKGPITWEQSLGQFANTVTVRYGTDRVVLKTWSATGDGVTTTFPLDHVPLLNFSGDVVSQGVITESGTQFYPLFGTVGGVTWTYNSGSNSLVRSPALPNTVPATWHYAVQFPQETTASDTASIVARGTWAMTSDAPDIFDLDEAAALATGLLSRSLAEPKIVKAKTRAGFEMPGTVITLTFTDRTISGAHLITEVSGEDVGDGSMEWALTCLSGSTAQDSWTDKLRTALTGGGGPSAGGTVSGGILPSPTGAFPDEVISNAGEDSATAFEASLRGYLARGGGHAGPYLQLGRSDNDHTWAVLADMATVGGGGSAVKRLLFVPINEGTSSDPLAAMLSQHPSTPVDGEYILLPDPSGKLTLGGDPSAFGGSTYRLENIFTRDCNAANGYYERGNSARMGEWTAVAHSAGNFTAGGSMTWTVASGDQITFAYTVIGKTCTVSLHLVTTTIGGTPSALLQVAIPAGMVAAKTMTAICQIADNGTSAIGRMAVAASGTTINISHHDGTTNFSASTDNTAVRGQITFEIQ